MLALFCAVLISCFLISASLTWVTRKLSQQYDWASGSVSSHHIHARRIPRLGGLAVFLAFFAALSLYMLASRWLHWPLIEADVVKLLLPSLFLFATGLVDDLRGLGARAKLAGQIVGGLLLYVSGLHLFDPWLRAFNPWMAVALSLAATVFFVVLMCNAMNLIDGLDGLAAGVSLFSMMSILVFALVGGATSVAVATIILGGAVAGFLLFNIWPASIFLGDSGSMFLGFMLSGLAISLSNRQAATLNSLALPAFCFALPLADTTISVLRRFLSGRPLFQADRGHVHHMLLNLGLSHRAAVWTLYSVAAVCTVLSLALLYPSNLLLISAGSALLVLVLFCVRRLGYQEFAEVSRIWQRVSAQRAAAGNKLRQASGHALARTDRAARVPIRSELDVEVDAVPPSTILSDVQAEEAAS